ncbi:MAG: arginase family protein, partial [Bacteroidia bacterium]|nr:arginase family protein [Bacteroidia bacterium]
IYEQLQHLDVDYVLFGVSEDVGVFANRGLPGTYYTWQAVIKELLNTEANDCNQAERLVVLGHLDFYKEHEIYGALNNQKAGDLKKARLVVSEIDKQVNKIVHDIVKAGKIPIIIGGGQNNAYGCIKGTSLALKSKINAINLDAHTDFRNEEGRHSGNGFTYAFNEGFLDKYFIFGLHEDHTSQRILNKIKKLSKRLAYTTFESIYIRKETKFMKECDRALQFIGQRPFGLEIDCNAIEGIPSRQMTPSGISPNRAREFVNFFGKHKKVKYLHISEAAIKNSKKNRINSARLLSNLITDFMRAKSV